MISYFKKSENIIFAEYNITKQLKNSNQFYKRMSMNLLCEGDLIPILSYLKFQDIKCLFFLNKGYNYFISKYLEKFDIEIKKSDLLHLSQRDIIKLLNICKSYSRLQLPILNARIYQISEKISHTLKIFKLLWVEQNLIYQKKFWDNILILRDNLQKISISTYRKIVRITQNNLRFQQPGNISINDMKSFFSKIPKLKKFSLKIQTTKNKNQQFNYLDYFKYHLKFQSFIVSGLLNSDTTIQSLKLSNIILKQDLLPQHTLPTLRKIKIIYNQQIKQSLANHLENNGYTIFRLKSQALIRILFFFPCLKNISILDFSNLDDKFLNQNSLAFLKQHVIINKQQIQIQIASYNWHWNMNKIDLFQFCELPIANTLKLRSLFAFDADSLNLRISSQTLLKLKSLDLSYTNINDSCLKLIEEFLPDIEQFGINGCKKLSRDGLMDVFSVLKKLKYVSVEQLHGFTNKCLRILIENNFMTLKEIWLKKNKINYESIYLLFTKCLKLKCVKLKNMNSMYEDFSFLWIEILFKNKFVHFNLEQIDLSNNSYFTQQNLYQFKFIFPNISYLKMMETIQFSEQYFQKQQIIHPNVRYLSAVFEFQSLKKFKQCCIKLFPKILILSTQLNEQLKYQIEQRKLEGNRNLLIYDSYNILHKI